MTIPVEQLGERLNKALETQHQNEAIELTKNDDTVAWVVPVPQNIEDDAPGDIVFSVEQPSGRRLTVHVEFKSNLSGTKSSPVPVFGAGRGTLSIVSEDED
jgi:hypothetical protein